jgi:hypothetical protein
MNAEELLKGILVKDEVIKWAAKPRPYSVTNEENKKSTYTFWIVAAATLVILNVAYIAFCAAGSADFKAGVLVITVGVPLFLFINPLRDEWHIAKQVLAITNKRVLVYHASNKEFYVRLEDVDAVGLRESTDPGRRHLVVCSAALNAPAKKLRGIAISGKRDKEDRCIGVAFYHIDAEEAARAHEIISAAASAAEGEAM